MNSCSAGGCSFCDNFCFCFKDDTQPLACCVDILDQFEKPLSCLLAEWHGCSATGHSRTAHALSLAERGVPLHWSEEQHYKFPKDFRDKVGVGQVDQQGVVSSVKSCNVNNLILLKPKTLSPAY